jgi:hypothetical protein
MGIPQVGPVLAASTRERFADNRLMKGSDIAGAKIRPAGANLPQNADACLGCIGGTSLGRFLIFWAMNVVRV